MDNDMEILRTNLFCLMGKPSSGRASIVKSVLSDEEFVQKYKIHRFTCGTTRPITPDDVIGETYFFFTEKEYRALDPSSIIEARSYDLITNNQTSYCFTLKDHIKFNTNYVGKVSLYQYEELKKWAEITELKNPYVQISLYPILIKCNAFERLNRLENKASTEDELYDKCARFITERFEYNTVVSRNPEIKDDNSFSTLILDNSKHDFNRIQWLAKDVRQFISVHLIMQQGT